MKFIIEEAVLVKLLDYLKKQPYVEVFQVIPYLQGLEKLNGETKEKIKEEEDGGNES